MEMTIGRLRIFWRKPKNRAAPFAAGRYGIGISEVRQPSPTLSGGEAQRLKLVTELTRGIGRAQNERIRQNAQTEIDALSPRGADNRLHMADVELLLKVLHRLVDEGNTVIVIEHNLSIIAEADYIVDIGPEAGVEGGEIVVSGTPEEVAKSRISRTAPFLRKVLKRRVMACHRGTSLSVASPNACLLPSRSRSVPFPPLG